MTEGEYIYTKTAVVDADELHTVYLEDAIQLPLIMNLRVQVKSSVYIKNAGRKQRKTYRTDRDDDDGWAECLDDINHPFGPLMHVHSLSICTMCTCMRVHNKRVSHACLFLLLYITLPTTNCSTTRNTWTPDPIYLYLTFTENCFSQGQTR